jgi:phosphoribosylformylglycinamidine cyclo-ligase
MRKTETHKTLGMKDYVLETMKQKALAISQKSRTTYASSGVDMRKEDVAMERILPLFEETFNYRRGVGKCVARIGHFAGLVQLNRRQTLAIKTDGVGTKIFIAELLQKYDTIGIDCIAMNVNDIICTGAEPISFVDYIAVQDPDPDMIEQVAVGLKKGAEIAKVNIVGGETAVVPEMIRGMREGRGLDLVGMCVGIVDPESIIDGKKVKDGDILLGISSSGLHSNGYTMARKILLENMHFDLDRHFDELGCTLGEELIVPTYIYVPEVLKMLRENLEIKQMAHITSRGFLNLNRVGKGYGYVIKNLPPAPGIFKLIQKHGNVTDAEMYGRFNMGIGMCLILPKKDVDTAIQIIEKNKKDAFILGYARKDPERRIEIRPLRLVGLSKGQSFKKYR